MKKIFLLVILGIVVFLLWRSGFFSFIFDIDALRQLILNAGPLGPLLFLLLMLLLFPIFAAGPLVWLSAAIWPMSLAIIYSSIGSILCGWVFFIIARQLGQEWADGKIPKKILSYEKKLEENPWKTIIILRFLLWINPAVDSLIGLSHIPTTKYLLASAAALIPLTIIHITVVTYGIDILSGLPMWAYVFISVVLLAMLARFFWTRKIKASQ